MYRPKMANNAVTTLATSIATTTQTSVTLTSSARFPELVAGEWYFITVVDAANEPEVMIVTAKTGSVLAVQRGKDNTLPRIFAAGATVAMNANTGYLETLAARDGSDATGIWGIDITGNSATVTQGVYTTGDQSIGGSKTFTQPINGSVTGASGTSDFSAISGGICSGVSSGSVNAIAATFVPNITALVDGTRIRVRGLSPNTVVNPTLAAGATAATPIKSLQNLDIPIGSMPFEGDFIYSSAASAWILQNQLHVSSGWTDFFAAPSPPPGWLKANGLAVSRTTYAALFAVIGTAFGVGDGVSTFNLPDLRGEFLRGWDDGRGIDAARGFATAQAQAIQSHNHSLGVTSIQSGGGVGGTNELVQSGGGGWSTGSAGGSETRPRNVALLVCIKY